MHRHLQYTKIRNEYVRVRRTRAMMVQTEGYLRGLGWATAVINAEWCITGRSKSARGLMWMFLVFGKMDVTLERATAVLKLKKEVIVAVGIT